MINSLRRAGRWKELFPLDECPWGCRGVFGLLSPHPVGRQYWRFGVTVLNVKTLNDDFGFHQCVRVSVEGLGYLSMPNLVADLTLAV